MQLPLSIAQASGEEIVPIILPPFAAPLTEAQPDLRDEEVVASIPIAFDGTPALAESQSDAPKLLCMELCAGSAGATAALLVRGFLCLAVDHSRNRHAPKAACAVIDLANQQGQSIIQDTRSKRKVFFTMMGPPCGTASRAREIPLSW